MKHTPQIQLVEFLGKHITNHKKEIISKTLEYRTRHITIVLEDIQKSQNASATIRTCDCLGIQDVHIIENRNTFNLNPKVVKGSANWIDIHRHNNKPTNNTVEAIQTLKDQGYWIIGTSPDRGSYTPQTLPLTKKVAILFGNEKNGLTTNALRIADTCLTLPIFGFTNSYNISVSVSMVLYPIITRLHKSTIPWQLSFSEKRNLTLDWYRRLIPHSEDIENHFANKYDF